MIIFFWISLLLYLLGAISSSRIKMSYLFTCAGSVAAFITGCYAMTHRAIFFNY